MQVYGDLILKLNKRKFTEVAEEVSRQLPAHWQRDLVREAQVNRTGGTQVCYKYSGGGNVPVLPDVHLWLYHNRERGEALVSNIVPIAVGQLSHKEYNEILTKFHSELLQGAANRLGLEAVLSKTNEVGIEDFISTKAAKALRSFSILANKSTGSSHPLDKQRWFDFIITCYKQKDNLPTDILRECLTADGWDLDSAYELVIEFEQGLSLLKQFDSV